MSGNARARLVTRDRSGIKHGIAFAKRRLSTSCCGRTITTTISTPRRCGGCGRVTGRVSSPRSAAMPRSRAAGRRSSSSLMTGVRRSSWRRRHGSGYTRLKELATPAGLEPATCRLEGGCSIQLSYGAERAKPTRVRSTFNATRERSGLARNCRNRTRSCARPASAPRPDRRSPLRSA